MDLISSWAARIAEEAAPDEIDLAPAMAQAFIQGGKEREQLFLSAAGGVPGAFGPGEGMALFPWLLKGISDAWPYLHLVLASATPLIATFVETINNLLEIHGRLAPKDKAEGLPDDPYAPLKGVIKTLSTEIRSSGISQDQSDLITFRVLRALLEDPESALTFVQKVKEAP